MFKIGDNVTSIENGFGTVVDTRFDLFVVYFLSERKPLLCSPDTITLIYDQLPAKEPDPIKQPPEIVTDVITMLVREGELDVAMHIMEYYTKE